MTKRLLFVLVAALVVVGAASCSKGDDDADPGSTSSSPNTTEAAGTTVITTGTTETTSTDDTSSSTSSQVSIPPVTPPPGQPAACSLLSRDALQAVGVPADDPGTPESDSEGPPAPSNSCDWLDGEMGVALFYGRDPLEILAAVRQEFTGGEDVTGIGSDAYFISQADPSDPESVTGAIFVDAGSQAFVVGGPFSKSQLETLAQNVLTNL